jgi:hypothetical protein
MSINKQVYLFYTLNPVCLTCKEPLAYIKSQESNYPNITFYYIDIDKSNNIDNYDTQFAGVYSMPTDIFTNNINYYVKLIGTKKTNSYVIDSDIKLNLDLLNNSN